MIRSIFILFVLLIWSPHGTGLHATAPGKDFLITLNGSKLTGKIKSISLSNKNSWLAFENDFGNEYVVRPATVNGFVLEENGEVSLYESKFLGGRWLFLKVENRSQALSLYFNSERQMKFVNIGEPPIVKEEKTIQTWLQFAKEEPVKIYRLNFKKILKKKMAAYPEIVQQLGKRGFKYRDLPAIVELYNRLYKSEHQGLTAIE